MKEYKKQELKSSEYYSSIVDVSFTPRYELFPERSVKKGDPIYEYSWFRKKKIGEQKQDLYNLYDEYGYSVYGSVPIESLAHKQAHRVVIDGKVYRMACISVTTKPGGQKTTWFNTDEEASSYLEEIKTKCGQCGNKLL